MNLGGIRPTDAILQRPADRRPELERIQPGNNSGKLFGEEHFEPGANALARFETFRDDDGLRKEVVCQLHVQRKIEADRALSDIDRRVLDIRIALEQLLEHARRFVGGVDR